MQSYFDRLNKDSLVSTNVTLFFNFKSLKIRFFQSFPELLNWLRKRVRIGGSKMSRCASSLSGKSFTLSLGSINFTQPD